MTDKLNTDVFQRQRQCILETDWLMDNTDELSTNSDWVIRQAHRYYHYQPRKSFVNIIIDSLESYKSLIKNQ